MNSSQKTGTIEIQSAEGAARISFKEGEIVHAHCHELDGKEAVFSALAIKNGQFVFTRGISAEVSTSAPLGGFIGLIMEGLQRIDEETQD